MKFIRAFFISAAIFFITTPCLGMTNKTIAVIQPGTGLGNITLGDKLSDVIRKMDRKKPTGGQTVKSGDLKEYWISYSDMGITFIFNEKERLERIAVSNPGIIVEQSDIRVNSSVKELERIFGRVQVREIDKKYEQRIYKNKGISFTINRETEKIEAITIERAIKK